MGCEGTVIDWGCPFTVPRCGAFSKAFDPGILLKGVAIELHCCFRRYANRTTGGRGFPHRSQRLSPGPAETGNFQSGLDVYAEKPSTLTVEAAGSAGSPRSSSATSWGRNAGRCSRPSPCRKAWTGTRGASRPSCVRTTRNRSNTVCHLLNLCRECGRPLRWIRRPSGSPAMKRPTICCRGHGAGGSNCRCSVEVPADRPRGATARSESPGRAANRASS